MSKMSMLTGGLALATGAIKCCEFVHAGEVAVKRRFGNYGARSLLRFTTFSPYVHTYKADEADLRYGIKSRGLAFSWPGIERWVHISTLPNTDNELPAQIVTTNKERQVKVGAAITWRVMNDEDSVYRALWAVNNNKAANIIPELRPLVIDTAAQQLAVVMNGKTFDEMHQFKDRSAEMMEYCHDPLYDMGISLDRVLFQSPYYTEADIAKEAITSAAETHASAIRELATAIRESSPSSPIGAAALTGALPQDSGPGLAIPFQVVKGIQ